jgi:hypothetical protein
VIATQNELPAEIPSSLRVVATPQSNAAWSLTPVDFVNAAQCGRERGAKAFLILGPEADSLSPLALRSLADAVSKVRPWTWLFRIILFRRMPVLSTQPFCTR